MRQVEIFNYLTEEIISIKDIEKESVALDSTFNDLDFDSLDFIEVQVIVKKRYNVDLNFELITKGEIKNLRDLVSYVEMKMPI